MSKDLIIKSVLFLISVYVCIEGFVFESNSFRYLLIAALCITYWIIIFGHFSASRVMIADGSLINKINFFKVKRIAGVTTVNVSAIVSLSGFYYLLFNLVVNGTFPTLGVFIVAFTSIVGLFASFSVSSFEKTLKLLEEEIKIKEEKNR